MPAIRWLVAPLISLLLQMPAMAWEEGDRQAYNNKMALTKVLGTPWERMMLTQGRV